MLAALREINDGQWSRNVGTDGGPTLMWRGRLVLIGAVTTAWDAAHQVVSAMGDRFVLVRLNSREHRRMSGRQAMTNVSSETNIMRRELADVVKALLGTVDEGADITLAGSEVDTLLDVADVVKTVSNSVESDGKVNSLRARAPEMPTRYAKLVQIARAAGSASI